MDIHPKTADAYRLLHEGTLALARAERQGIRLDTDYIQKQRHRLSKRIELLEAKFKRSNFYKRWYHSIGNKDPNIYSNAQLSHYLYKVKKLSPLGETTSGQGATDENALTQLNIPELNDILQIRKLKKIRDTYLEGFAREAVDGVLHPFFNLHLVKTFRSSSDRPNFQNIPKRDKEAMQIVRKSLYPRKGHQLMEIDYSSLEVRIAQIYHQDPVMLKYITDPTTDMHRDMAMQIFILKHFDKTIPEHKTLRYMAKNGFVFPQFYGDFYKSCAYNIANNHLELPNGKWKKGMGIAMPEGHISDHLIANGIRSIDHFIEHIKAIETDFWQNRFKVYAKWKDQWFAKYIKRGYVDLKTGFRCSGVMSRNDSINYPIQGAAFHCLLKSFIMADHIIQVEKLKSRLVGQIHDSMILDVHPSEVEHIAHVVHNVTCSQLLKEWPWITVPLEVEMDLGGIDESWVSLKPYSLP